MRRLALAALLALLPVPALAQGAVYACTPTQRLHCTAEGGCEAQQPDIEALRFAPVEGHLQYCRFGTCFQGIADIEREGWPTWHALGVAMVEALPLTRDYRGRALFASFEVNERRFVLSSLGTAGQDITWFDCGQAE